MSCQPGISNVLSQNTGRPCTLFTTGQPDGFTGLLAGVSNGCARLITNTCSAPRNPLAATSSGCGCGGGSPAFQPGTSCFIPVNQITCALFNEV